MQTGPGQTFSVGGIAATIALLLQVFVSRPAAVRLGAIVVRAPPGQPIRRPLHRDTWSFFASGCHPPLDARYTAGERSRPFSNPSAGGDGHCQPNFLNARGAVVVALAIVLLSSFTDRTANLIGR